MQLSIQVEKTFTIALFLVTALLQNACASGLERYSLTKQSGIAFVEFNNAAHGLNVPTRQLANAKIINFTNALSVVFSKEKHFSFGVLTREGLGVPDKQFILSDIAEYLIGNKPLPTHQTDAYRAFYETTVTGLSDILIKGLGKPVRTGYLDIADGNVYIAIGNKEAVLFIYTSTYPDILSQLSLYGFSINEIEELILQGYIQ